MTKNRIITFNRIIAIFLCLFVLFTAWRLLGSGRKGTTIRLHDDQVDIQKFTNAIARFIIENGYGYRVQLVESTIKEVHELLITGNIDVTLELWKDNNLAWYQSVKEKGDVIDLGPIYTGGRQYWIIPQWYAREKQITTVFQMQQNWQDFTNSEDPSKGIFFNCIFGWSCRDINRVKLEAYGLDRYYNMVSPTSPEALKSIYENAKMRRLPVFGYYWEPNALIAGQDWYALEEPPHSPEVWEKIIRAATDPDAEVPDTACAFKDNSVHKFAHRQLLAKAPDAADMLKKMTLDGDIFHDILFIDTLFHRTQDDYRSKAIEFLKKYPRQWQEWVTPKALKKVNAALVKEPVQSDSAGQPVPDDKGN